MWTRDFVKNMKTHENTVGSDETTVEFCYFDNYLQLNENYSTSIINSTPQQAWRAGFREGVYKTMCTDWDHVQVRDFTYLNSVWQETYSKITQENLLHEIILLGETLINELNLPIAENPFDKEQSAFFKTVKIPTVRNTRLK